MRQVGNHVLGVDDFNVVRCLNVSSSDLTFAVFAQAQGDFVTVVQFEHHAFEVQQNVDHVFLHAIDGRVFVQHASNGDIGHGIANHGRQQHAAQSIAQGVAVTTLERLEGHFGFVVTELFNLDGFGLQEICLHSFFLSMPPARYTGKAG